MALWSSGVATLVLGIFLSEVLSFVDRSTRGISSRAMAQYGGFSQLAPATKVTP
ncbi:MAG: hypothetical protein GY953_53390 [bacterium]|nr:hypothetical protein [bacterium]